MAWFEGVLEVAWAQISPGGTSLCPILCEDYVQPAQSAADT